MKNHKKCRQKTVQIDDHIRHPGHRIPGDGTDIRIKTVQQITVLISADLLPVRVDNLIENIRMDIIIHINTDFQTAFLPENLYRWVLESLEAYCLYPKESHIIYPLVYFP